MGMGSKEICSMVVKKGDIFTAADGGRYGYIALGPPNEVDEVPVMGIRFEEGRSIDSFKLSYLYKPYFEDGVKGDM